MKLSKTTGSILAGTAAGAVNGLFGAGGGMVLIPLLCLAGNLEEEDIFPSSVAIILPICLISLSVTMLNTPLPWKEAWPYLLGSAIGGILAGLFGQRVPTKWLHRLFGALIIFGGIRYLC